MQGALWNDQVLLFSNSPLGAPPALPFTYTLSGTATRTHTLFNMIALGGYDLSVIRAAGQTTVTVSLGAAYNANSQGVLRFTD
jgi:hypothetical protein